MVYAKYGDTFKKLRTQHNKTLRDFEEVGVSKGALSQFENGKTLLSFDKLDMALQSMHVTMLAYILMINNGVSDYYLTQFMEIDKAFISKDKNRLIEIEKQNTEVNPEEGCAVAIAARAGYTEITKEQKEKVETYFKGCYMWSRYELYLLINTAEQIDNELLVAIIKSFFEEQKNYYLRERQEFKHLITRILANAILKLIRGNNSDVSQELMRYLHLLPTEFELTERIVYVFLEGAWIYKFQSEKLGTKIIQRCLRILSDIYAIEFRMMMQEEYRRLIESSR